MEQTRVQQRLIEEEMKQSYLDYAMSVIVGRALPDVRDGLKPVHRRILFSMWDNNWKSNVKFVKSAKIVGAVIGNLHPHGDTAVYDSMVRMAQDFSLRYTLVNGQGNFGSRDGDNAAAYRYCVTGDTLILTDKGVMPIKDISDKKESRIDMSILSYDGKRNKATKFFNSGYHKTIRLQTKSGYFLEGSYNHPVMAWVIGEDFKPKIEWKLLEELKENDVVLINRENDLFSKASLKLNEYFPKDGFRNEINLPSKMNNDLAFLLGALVSEGSYHNKQILFNNKDKEFYDKVKSIILTQFRGIQLYEREIKGRCKELSIYEQKVVKFLENIGLSNAKSDKKEIPFSVLRSDKKDIKNFLIGLFEGDGGVKLVIDKRHSGKRMNLTYDSKSQKLIYQIKTILLNFGIMTSKPLIDKRNGCFKIYISNVDGAYRFFKEIGFFSDRKKEKLKEVIKINKNRLSKNDFIPFLNDYLRNKYSGQFIIKNNFDRYNSLKKNYSKLIKIIDNEDKKLIDWLSKNRFYFDQLIKVEKTGKSKEVFSIKVNSRCHSFIANGFINHNTEAKLQKFAEELLIDIDKETVDFVDNFDASMKEPLVLPAKIPNLLVNGSSGIAVGMATNMLPHNIREVIGGCISMIDDPEIDVMDLMKHVLGPDFPTGGIIMGKQGILNAYKTGRGKVLVRGVVDVEEVKGRERLIITELPYQVNKALMIENIANLVKDKRIEGISDLRDESDRTGMRVVVELKSGANTGLILNQLYKHTTLQTSFGIINLALVNGVPKVLGLKEILGHFIEHRKDVVTRRTKFELDKAEKRAHILEGLRVALENIDDVVALIKGSKDALIAKEGLMSKYSLSEIQAQAILDMRLQRLTSLETEKINKEYEELLKLIIELKGILADVSKVFAIIKDELVEMRSKYGDDRKTQFMDSIEVIEDEDLIKKEDVVITMTGSGYIKRLPMDTYKQQGRGGKGVKGTGMKEEDFVDRLFICGTHDYLLFFTDLGRVHWLKGYAVPEGGRYAKGSNIVNMLSLSSGESVSAVIPLKGFGDGSLLMCTKKGLLKKTKVSAYSRPRKGGIVGIKLREEDKLIDVKLVNGGDELIIGTRKGMAVRFNSGQVRDMGRNASGVRGVRLVNDVVIGMANSKDTLLTVTENGYGKRSKVEDYRLVNRGAKGVINIKCSERNGKVVGIKQVRDGDELIFITKNGMVTRVDVSNISVIGRNAQGVRLMKLNSGDKIIGVAKVANGGN